jgi:hypothetical protein
MKRLILLSVFLLTVSLACKALQPQTATFTPTAELTFTASPFPTPSPTDTATPLSPTPEPISCNNDGCLQDCLDRIEQVLSTQEFSPLSEVYAESKARFSLVSYKVDGDKLGAMDVLWAPGDYKVYQDDIAAQARIWDYLIAILPADQRKWISDFLIFTDGPKNILAYVRRSNDPQKWTLGADIIDSSKPIYLTDTLLHEFGHLLTLNTEQLTISDTYIYNGQQGLKGCPTFAHPEGCSTPDSYINLFYQRFWTKIYKEWFDNVDQASNGELNWDLVSAFYRRYPDQFVSEYAASQPSEDIAESFAYFILHPKPSGKTIADQKVKFFYEFPELVALRQYAIQGMCSYSK